MKKCPYCAEEIKDEAIKCRYCQSWLVDEIPSAAVTPPAVVRDATPHEAVTQVLPAVSAQPTAAGAATAGTPAEPRVAEPAVETAEPPAAQPPGSAEDRIEFTHSGERYLLGYGRDYFGIWDRQAPATPKYRFLRSDDGWRAAWQQYVQVESNWMEVKPP